MLPLRTSMKHPSPTDLCQDRGEQHPGVRACAPVRDAQIIRLPFWIVASSLLLCPQVEATNRNSFRFDSRSDTAQLQVPPARNSNNEKPYRPWASRFALKRANLSNPELRRPEFRAGYRRFHDVRVGHPLVPDSMDREAQSVTIMVCAIAALLAVFAGSMVAESFQREQERRQLMGLFVCVCLPAMLALGWFMRVGAQHMAHPTRNLPFQCWQCHALVWYLILAPVMGVLTLPSQILWLVKAQNVNEQSAPMGHLMRNAQSEAVISGYEYEEVNRASMSCLQLLPQALVRHCILALEILVTIFGAFLVPLGESVCQPELWWGAVALTASTAILLLAGGLALGCLPAIFGGNIAALWVFGDVPWKDVHDSSAQHMLPLSIASHRAPSNWLKGNGDTGLMPEGVPRPMEQTMGTMPPTAAIISAPRFQRLPTSTASAMQPGAIDGVLRPSGRSQTGYI